MLAYVRMFMVATALSAPAIVLGGEPVELAQGVVPKHPRQPQLAVDKTGAIHVVYGVGNEIRYCRSDDGGKSFSGSATLPTAHTLSLGMRRGPRIALADAAICVTAIGGQQGKGRDGDLLAFRSTDRGQTWTAPVAVNDVVGAAREGLHAMAAGPKELLCCVWLDLRKPGTVVMAAVSPDGGKTWGNNSLVYRSPDASVCQCCHPSVAIDAEGRIFVLWRNSLAGARDMYVASSSDRGQSFSAGAKLGRGSWPLDACPMDGGGIAVTSLDKFATAWRRDKGIFLLLDGQREERSLGTGEQPWIAATAAGPFVVWLKKRGEAALLLSPGSSSPIELSAHASDPVIAAGPSGRGPVVAAWETHVGEKYTIQCQVVSESN